MTTTPERIAAAYAVALQESGDEREALLLLHAAITLYLLSDEDVRAISALLRDEEGDDNGERHGE